MPYEHSFSNPNIVFGVENFNCWGEGNSEVILYSDGRLMTVNNNGVQTLIVTNIKLAQEVEFFVLENSGRILQLPDSDQSGVRVYDVCPHKLNFCGKKCCAYMAVSGNDEFKYFYSEVSRIIRKHGYLKDHRAIRDNDEKNNRVS